MRIASYNVDNLFDRATALQASVPPDERRRVLEQQAQINALFEEAVYTEAVKAQILKLLAALGLKDADDGGDYAILRQNRGWLLDRTRTQVEASGRGDWVGWVDLKELPTDEVSTRHTAMVLRDVAADIQAVVEVEDRFALCDFSNIMLPKVGGTPFAHAMVIDGNDGRRINVGILTGTGYELVAIRSHVDDTEDGTHIFSRDCPDYTVATPSGERLVLLVNHLRSKGYGDPAEANRRRERQASRVAEIYRELRDAGQPNVAVVGDFNDTPDSPPLAPLLVNTDLRDITAHTKFEGDAWPGTYGDGSEKIDYLLLSPALFDRVTGGAIFRKGVWGGKDGPPWPHYETMKNRDQSASDHAAIYADLAL